MPDSNSPSWFDVPMKIAFTALTRPRISSGVSSCTSASRIDHADHVDRARARPAPPATAKQCVETARTPASPRRTPRDGGEHGRPTRRWMAWRASHSDISSAPTAGAARSRPRPHGPVCRMSRAKIGSSAVAPPSSTANRSSEMTPSTSGRARMKCTPANTDLQRGGSRGGGAAAYRRPRRRTAAPGTARRPPCTRRPGRPRTASRRAPDPR